MSDSFFRLLSKAQSLDEALWLERGRPTPNAERLRQLFRMKQNIKNRLAQLMRGGRVLGSV